MNLHDIYKVFMKSTGICTDTRSILPGNLFFALKGPNFNANKLAKEAIEKGAIAAIVDEQDFHLAEQTILVDDGLETLQKLANHHRRQFNIPFIGITGSNGKTTTKELIAAALSTTFKTHFTEGNLNNHIGVPLTLLSLPSDAEIAIIEMGANHIGEIAELCTIAEPDYGIITNIGKAHLEGFGSLEGVARGKSELFYHVLKHGKNIFVNSQDTHLSRMAGRFENPLTFPAQNDYYHCALMQNSKSYVEIQTDNGDRIQSQLTGNYNFTNIAAALCIAKYFKVDATKASNAIRTYQPTNNRSQIVKKGAHTVILDAYNANPSSMQASIDNFNEMEGKHKVVILGDMLELGNESKSEHQSLGAKLTELNFDLILLCGSEMKFALDTCPKAHYFETPDQLRDYLSHHKQPASNFLIKGSRGMKLETIFDLL